MNITILSGHLGNDPEMRYSQAGKPVTKFNLATNTGSGDYKRTDWHRIVCFGKTAENCAKYLTKGSRVEVEGSIKYGDWTGEDGVKKYFTEIIADRVHFVSTDRSESRESRPAEPSSQAESNDNFTDDDIPF